MTWEMSVTEAGKHLCPVGTEKGRPLRDLDGRQLHFVSRLSIFPYHSEDHARAVVAARIYLKYRRRQKLEQTRTAVLDDAKWCLAKCNSCNASVRVPTKIFDRAARPTCHSCGGTIAKECNASPDLISVRRAAELASVTTATVLSHRRQGKFPGAIKRGGLWLLPRDQVRQWCANVQGRRKRSTISGGRPATTF